eukprot:NODE_1452_length_2472_cov_19.628998.p1 GENE.NODE_1452_length_2472_cov_19.628998~~NODE_1452_length_2472_cov_19.628998.p1  ORF type:complete len:648 (-),score=158.73 NODE_1452_length_2472_cov_19.628998:245-2188(-)
MTASLAAQTPRELRVLFQQVLDEHWARISAELYAEMPSRVVEQLMHDSRLILNASMKAEKSSRPAARCDGDNDSVEFELEVSRAEIFTAHVSAPTTAAAPGAAVAGRRCRPETDAVAAADASIQAAAKAEEPATTCAEAGDNSEVPTSSVVAGTADGLTTVGIAASSSNAAECANVEDAEGFKTAGEGDGDVDASEHKVLTRRSTSQLIQQVQVNRTPCSEAEGPDLTSPEKVAEFLANESKDPAQCLINLVNSIAFLSLSSGAIIANAMFMGFESNTKVTTELNRLRGEEELDMLVAPDYIFTSFFVVELVLRMLAHRKQFLCGPDASWNIFDFILIAASIYELAQAGEGASLSVWRILRIFRLVRLLKVIRRVEFLESLNAMVYGIINCVAPLFWASIIMCLIMYAFTVFFMSVIASHLNNQAVGTDNQTILDIDDMYSTVYKTMCTLFNAITGGADWGDLCAPLKDISEIYYVCYALYIIFVTLGVLNIVTGYFVDGTMQQCFNNREELVQAAMEKKGQVAEILREVFHMLDSDGSGALSLDELEQSLDDRLMLEYFEYLGIDGQKARDLFNIVNILDNGDVPIDTFVEGVAKLTAPVKSIDIYSILTQNRKLCRMVEEFELRMAEKLASVTTMLELVPGSTRP